MVFADSQVILLFDFFQTVMEQFNPGLRTLVVLGKNYEKSISAMVTSGKTYFDAVAKLGDLTGQSPVSRELGHILTDISEVHKKLNLDLEESFKKFHREIIAELDRKTELDVKYMNATLKKYQTEHRSKQDSLEKSQAELKKLRRKSQGTKNAHKYEYKEQEFIANISSREHDIQKFINDGCKEALLEEKRRFCFLVEKHCNFSQDICNYHDKAKGLLSAKLVSWQEKCLDSTKTPEFLMDDTYSTASYVLRTPQPSPSVERYQMGYDSSAQNTLKIPPAPPGRVQISPLADMFNPSTHYISNMEKTLDAPEDSHLQRSTSVATGLNMVQRPKVKTIFPHNAGNNKTMLSFSEGDVLTLLIPEEKDGWLYGEHDITKMRGWFPSSYTRTLEGIRDQSPAHSPVPVRSISTLNLAERSKVVLPPPDYLVSSDSYQNMNPSKGSKLNLYNSATSRGFAPKQDNTNSNSEMNGIMKPPFLSDGNPFATVKLRPTVTNDRSAPVI
uniref:BAR/IMD domain containing adaptor protein 2 like 1a n=1 Tax=Callorhinchus milii TaxID=7868 RepID=A0A4W3HAD7_CALMI